MEVALPKQDKLREIVLDTETTDLSTRYGYCIIEIECVELINRIPTGKVFHRYINPEGHIDKHVFGTHVISEEFLKGKPLFSKVALEFLEFISSDILVIHNAPFDVRLLNMEFGKLNAGLISSDRVTDTLPLARKKFPGSPASLSALCKRFDISLENRELHGALIDSQLLAKVYVELTGNSLNQCKVIQHKVHSLALRKHSPSNNEQLQDFVQDYERHQTGVVRSREESYPDSQLDEVQPISRNQSMSSSRSGGSR
ncbi:DNA polymerase III subunit epsilon [Wolbachia endosymbiont of Mansonella ozzardi]|uniref:DNA polymerase III subunit epsilon n=1 Tax=Wolbachia endosymbiont of Mansonella ozzardi TaxID=137464 RepID=UPI001CE180C1|nr:DNA polymerase III subunit epsilon [Wolbachia endosymbiont of Mansonella ozzardi]MCA4774591.1 DNA polymerase III subunit epsilon [Wolbachia endosymbiont of Mansonella ozzardi]